MRLFLCGDVMTGRGVDQILPVPSDPRLYELYVRDARRYVELARKTSGEFPGRVEYSYPWGDALETLDRLNPDVRIANLETAVTDSDDSWANKGIHYRMHPGNVHCLTAAAIDCYALANNHVLDWGYAGLADTLRTLRKANVHTAGAGNDVGAAKAPAVIDVAGKGRVLVLACASPTSGVPRDWAATRNRPGINFLADFSSRAVRRIAADVRAEKRDRDVVVASIHWGGNWGYDIPEGVRRFAHRLIDEAGIDLIHGHSSHHPKGIEIHAGKPILYGCGDFLNDYEGIPGHESYRPDLVLGYLPTLEPQSGSLVRFEMLPFRIARFQLNHPSTADAEWLQRRLNRECARFGGRVELSESGHLTLTTADVAA